MNEQAFPEQQRELLEELLRADLDSAGFLE